MKWFTYATYLLLICGMLLGAFPRAIGGLKPHEILLVLLAGSLALTYVLCGKTVQFSLLDAAFLLLLLAGSFIPLVTMEVRGNPITSDALKSLLAPVEYYLWYRVFLAALPIERELPRLLPLLLVLLTLIGLGGDLQAIHFPGVARILELVSSTHQASISASVARPTSFVGEWGLLASLVGFALLLINQIITSGEGARLFGPHWRRWLIGMMVINIFALVATLAVEGFIALLLGYTIAYWLNRRRLARETTIGLGIAAFSALAITPALLIRLNLQFTSSASFIPATWQVRFLHWQIVLQSIWSAPNTVILGVNPSFLYPVSQFGGTESLYWLLWYRGGILYLGAFLAFLAIVIRTAWCLQKQTSGLAQTFSRWAFTVLVVIGSIGVIDALFVDGGEVQLLMTVIAVLGGMLQQAQRPPV